MEKKPPQCPKGHGDMKEEKRWKLKGKGNSGFLNKLWKCPVCGAIFRETVKEG